MLAVPATTGKKLTSSQGRDSNTLEGLKKINGFANNFLFLGRCKFKLISVYGIRLPIYVLLSLAESFYFYF